MWEEKASWTVDKSKKKFVLRVDNTVELLYYKYSTFAVLSLKERILWIYTTIQHQAERT